MLAKSDVITRNNTLLSTVMDGEVVMMNAEDGIYFSISEGVGATIWDGLETPQTVGELISLVQSSYKVDPKECEADVIEFVDSLLDQKIAFKQG